MKEFYYKAKKSPQEAVEGIIKADDRNSALLRLSDEGLYPFELKEKAASKNFFSRFFLPKKVSLSKMASLTRNVSDLLDGGVPVLEAFDTVSRNITHSLLKKIVEKIKKDLQEGLALSMSLQNQSEYFSPLFIHLVKAGEISGTMEKAFSRIADFYDRKQTLKNSILKSMAYPAFLLCIGLLTLTILFIFIIPKLMPVFEDMGVTIPTVTRILIKTSHIIEGYWKLIVFSVLAAAVVFKKFITTKEGRYLTQKLLLKLPFVRTIILKKGFADCFYSFGTLIQNGVPPSQSLEITRDSVENILLKRDFEIILKNFRKGEKLSDLMEKSPLFFPDTVNMIRVGEKTGNLEQPLLKLSKHYERDVQQVVEAFLTVIEPAMILLFGALIGFIAISILLPIFQLNFSVT
jgi:type II secretory pathway component PulF